MSCDVIGQSGCLPRGDPAFLAWLGHTVQYGTVSQPAQRVISFLCTAKVGLAVCTCGDPVLTLSASFHSFSTATRKVQPTVCANYGSSSGGTSRAAITSSTKGLVEGTFSRCNAHAMLRLYVFNTNCMYGEFKWWKGMLRCSFWCALQSNCAWLAFLQPKFRDARRGRRWHSFCITSRRIWLRVASMRGCTYRLVPRAPTCTLY